MAIRRTITRGVLTLVARRLQDGGVELSIESYADVLDEKEPLRTPGSVEEACTEVRHWLEAFAAGGRDGAGPVTPL
jgi:hypothetical protein